uniref:Uncharacterized protein LOC110195229 n=1 Tax=Phascolarctos cinereus TaxID=38626 RepID=A0A6P5IN37_PHACI|nr:uncharacterized protein LOC110195229 [Phascolarctos cinereus]
MKFHPSSGGTKQVKDQGRSDRSCPDHAYLTGIQPEWGAGLTRASGEKNCKDLRALKFRSRSNWEKICGTKEEKSSRERRDQLQLPQKRCALREKELQQRGEVGKSGILQAGAREGLGACAERVSYIGPKEGEKSNRGKPETKWHPGLRPPSTRRLARPGAVESNTGSEPPKCFSRSAVSEPRRGKGEEEEKARAPRPPAARPRQE